MSKNLSTLLLIISGILSVSTFGTAQSERWYTQGAFKPVERVQIQIINSLDFNRDNCPIVIKRNDFPIQDLHEFWVTVVDPDLPSDGEPTKELLARQGFHQARQEKNGHHISHQLDDLDKDGLWDELFFMTDLKASETKIIYVYLGFNQRGWNPHATHAGIGSYCRHLVPFWESEHVGWKLWYASDCDIYGKRTSQLMSVDLYMKNLDGYGVPYDMGSDIMSVSNSFGGGGICVFEHAAYPDSISRPRFTPAREKQGFRHNFNVGQVSDTRYAFDVVVNGPLRSTIKVKTMNWNTGTGSYELEQNYTAYAHHNYAICKVKFHQFNSQKDRISAGVGIRKNQNEMMYYNQSGVIITAGPEEIRNPDDIEGLQKLTVDYVGTALVVKEEYQPIYHFISGWKGNHVFQVTQSDDIEFEYLIAAGWSEGSVLRTLDDFKKYVLKISLGYFRSPQVIISTIDKRIGD